MIALPAIDLRGGRVVQLVGGRPEDERVSLPDPLDVAGRWRDAGFRWLHVVDLDAALGHGSNRVAVERILAESGLPAQVGGGARDDAAVDALFDAGAARVIVGTRAVEDAAWLDALTARHPGRIVVAADVRGDEVVVRGWRDGAGVSVTKLLNRLAPLPLAAILVTDVSREGSLSGADAGRFGALVASAKHPLQAAGGVASIDDLRRLDRAGVAGAVLGMALYTGAVDAAAAAREFTE